MNTEKKKLKRNKRRCKNEVIWRSSLEGGEEKNKADGKNWIIKYCKKKFRITFILSSMIDLNNDT